MFSALQEFSLEQAAIRPARWHRIGGPALPYSGPSSGALRPPVEFT
jgi:hypothetical protein